MLEANTNDKLIHYIHSREMAMLDEIAKQEKAKKKGIEQGIGQGEEQRNRAIVLNMLGQGIEIATIAQLTGISLEKVKNIVSSVTN